MSSRFRMTVWPSEVPAVSQIDDVHPFVLDGDLLRLDLAQARIQTFDIPDELYLRQLGELDLDSSEDIVEFTNTYGRLGHGTSSMDRQIIRHLGIEVDDERNLPWDYWFNEIDERLTIQEGHAVERKIIVSDGLQHIDTFRAWAQAFRQMTSVFEAHQNNEADQWELHRLAVVLDELLEPFHPTIAIHSEDAEGDDLNPFEDRHPRLENVLALQLYRHIASSGTYRRCASETCGRLFVHQSGRAEHGQHRSEGVLYCSDSCAGAQASREYRRRRKTNTKEA